MESPVVAQLFRQLFSHRAAHCARRIPAVHLRLPRVSRRGLSFNRDGDPMDSKWQQRTDMFPLDKSEEYRRYPMVTAENLKSRRERPRRVKMLLRDFIEGNCPESLYRDLADKY
jgi:hypothetical protein